MVSGMHVGGGIRVPSQRPVRSFHGLKRSSSSHKSGRNGGVAAAAAVVTPAAIHGNRRLVGGRPAGTCIYAERKSFNASPTCIKKRCVVYFCVF